MGKPRYFVISPYHCGEDGKYRPDMPTHGPCRQTSSQCGLSVKNRRPRKTGPCFALYVIYCRAHDVCFTLYPPGQVPYGRTALVVMGPEGKSVVKDRGPPFAGTYFDAALDAARGIAWGKESYEGSQHPRFLTQCRHLCRCARLMGLGATEREREKVAELLGIAGLELQEAGQAVQSQQGYRETGLAICQVLTLLPETQATFQRLTTCGYYVGIWPRVQWWAGRRWRCSGLAC